MNSSDHAAAPAGATPTGPSPSEQTRLRQQHAQDELCAASARALSTVADLHYRQRILYRNNRRLPGFAPHLHPVHGQDDWRSFRAASDGAALRLRYSDPARHRALCNRLPLTPFQRLIFEMLEQTRVESLAIEMGLPGVVNNLRHRFQVWAVALGQSALAETEQGLILLTLALIGRARVLAEPIPEALVDMIESTRFALSKVVAHDLRGLRLTRDTQALYGEHALNIARLVTLHFIADQVPSPAKHTAPVSSTRARFSLWIDFDGGEDQAAALSIPSLPLNREDGLGGYTIFTTAYDRTVQAADLVRPDERQTLRQQLDTRIEALGVPWQPMVPQIVALLSRSNWQAPESGHDEGRIDGRRLSQLLANPLNRHLFTGECQRLVTDARVCFLIDCSGSMKAQREPLALVVDLMTRALDLAGVPCEVLGFTTGAYSGGRALRDWHRAGQPPAPGRLNECCHIVFKSSEQSWRLARRDMAALLKPELYRECLNGEALLWAEQRLLAHTASRRILLVISDGCPSDSATAQTNGPQYLEQHLQTVTERIERSGRIELTALGVGQDMSGHYRHSDMLDFSELKGQRAAFTQILSALRPRRR